MRRPEHLLKPSGVKAFPSDLVCFDTETNQVEQTDGSILQTLKMGVAVHMRTLKGLILTEQSSITFHTAPELWDYITNQRKKSTRYITSHNIVFDLAVSDGFNQLAQKGYQLKSFYSKAMVSIFRWTCGDKKIIAIDNTNLFPGKLSRWGELFNIPKLEVDFETVDDKTLAIYCRRDVDILITCWRKWFDFLAANGCGAWKPTTASTAFNTWRHRFMPLSIHIHNNEQALQLERDAYRGGRVECFFKGRPPGNHFYTLDVTNMYGYVLKRYSYPSSLQGYTEKPTPDYLIRKLGDYQVIASVDLKINEPVFPLVYNGHTAYPVGYMSTTLSSPELIYALQHGWLLDIHAMSWYKQAPLFSEYVKTFYNLRDQYKKEGNSGYAEICKLLINGLYGKFGQSGMDQKRVGDVDINRVWRSNCIDVETGENYVMTMIGGGQFEERQAGEAYHSFPGIAAHVTALARMHLWRLIQKVPKHHLFYCDTDSLIVDEIGKQALEAFIQPGVMGMLKIEYEADSLEIRSPKSYTIGDKMKMKGVSSAAIRIDDNSFSQFQWTQFNGLIQQGDTSKLRLIPVIKHQSETIYSGWVTSEGWIEPFVLDASFLRLTLPLPLPLLRPSE